MIEGNTCYNHPSKHGITSQQCKDLIVRRNICYDNAQGIGVYSEDSPQIYCNICYSNTTAEINVSIQAGEGTGCNNAKIYNNTMYADSSGGHALQIGASTVNEVENNIGYTADDGNVYAFNMANSSTIASCDNNCWYAPNSAYAPDVNYNNTEGATWAEWKVATYDANGINSDPLFTDLDSNDFTLQLFSPCIDAGTDVGLTEDYAGNEVSQGSAPDIGAHEAASGATIIIAILEDIILPIVKGIVYR